MDKRVTFETNLTKCHLRGLSFKTPFLFIGMGSTLHILRTDTNGSDKLILAKDIFKNLVISKIETFKCIQSNLEVEIIVLIHGNRFLSIHKFSFNYVENKCFLSEELKCHNFYDWILSVKMIRNLVFVVKAHNEVDIFDLKTKQTIATASADDKCLLYSAELMSVSESGNSLVLSSGTVFKEIIIWTAYQTQNDSQLVSKTLQRLSGHNGVIFSLNYNKSLNILISASDDRSVRIWTSSLDSKDFCDSIEFWNRNKFTASHVFYGHLSRIWMIKTITDPFPIVLSVGEDSSLCLWNIYERKLIQRVNGKRNSSIWSLCLDVESMIAYFGGSDSSLTSCHISNSIKPFDCVVRHELQPKQIKLIGLKYLFCSTISGDLLLMSAQNDKNVVKNSDYNHIFQTYSAIDINKPRNHILLGSKCGTIASIKVKNQNSLDIQIKRVQISKVFSICFVDSLKFIICGIDGIIKLLSITTLAAIEEYVLPNSKHRWPVAALLHKNLLVVGDRCGSVFVYFKQNMYPINEFCHIHGSNGVTAIKLKPKSELLYSSGRNGKIFEFLLEDSNCFLLRIFRIFSDMEWIANFQFDEQTNEMSFIYGFQSRNFLVWDERQQRFIETIECGGGHRSWDFDIRQNRFYLCHTKQENVISFDKQMSNFGTDSKLSLTRTSHSKKINCCSLLFIDSYMYFGTAGEENVIHINSLDVETNDWRIESYLFGHISNICALSCCVCDNVVNKNSCYMVSVGGRAQLMVWNIVFKEKQLFCKQLFNKFLWPLDVIQNRCHKNNNFQSSSDPQIRYLDANMSRMDDNKYLVSAACSDSAFRLFVFNSDLMTFEMVGVKSFNTCCVLRVLNIFNLHAMTASNDGSLKIWAMNRINTEECDFEEFKSDQMNVEQVLDIKLHECGVNALDIFSLKEYLWLLASGGDDNTLSLSVIQYKAKNFNKISSIEEKHIHCCQITGIKIISNNRIVSAAIDQRVVIWNYSFNSKTLELKLESMGSYISSIADISSFCLTSVPHKNRWKTVICGEGFQVMDIHILDTKDPDME